MTITLHQEQEGLMVLNYIKNEVAEISLLHILAGDLHTTLIPIESKNNGKPDCYMLEYTFQNSAIDAIVIQYQFNSKFTFVMKIFPKKGSSYPLNKMINEFGGRVSFGAGTIETNDANLIISALKHFLTKSIKGETNGK